MPGKSQPHTIFAVAPTPSSALDLAVGRVGDRWSLLIVDSLMDGPLRFNELAEALPGIAANVLSQRLKHLEKEAVVVARPYSRRPPRMAYELTAEGGALADALRLLGRWGSRRAPQTEEPRHLVCGTLLESRPYCPSCERVVDEDDGGLRYL
jgi:DNA-binding HxlR family transcriptional regulator